MLQSDKKTIAITLGIAGVGLLFLGIWFGLLCLVGSLLMAGWHEENN